MLCGTVCIGHLPPSGSLPQATVFLSPRLLGVPNEIVVPDDRFVKGVRASYLSEYSQLFYLSENRHIVQSCSEIFFYQYRKFIGPIRGNSVFTNQSYAFLCKESEVRQFFPSDEYLSRSDKPLYGRPVDFQMSTVRFYARHHVLEDLLNFARAAVDSGVLLPDEGAELLSKFDMIPAPALGKFSKSYFFHIVEKLEAVWEVFAAKYFVEREGYQRRVGGFLLERLHSYLLLKAVKDDSSNIDFGFQFIVSDSNVMSPSH